MADIWSKRKRSEVMSKIRSHGNKETELRMIEILRENKVQGWRRRQAIEGKPDFVFRAEKVAVFVDGCFWHGCGKCYRRPKSNQAYWDEKVFKNRARDRKVNRNLKTVGWEVIRFWEHQLNREEWILSKLVLALSRK